MRARGAALAGVAAPEGTDGPQRKTPPLLKQLLAMDKPTQENLVDILEPDYGSELENLVRALKTNKKRAAAEAFEKLTCLDKHDLAASADALQASPEIEKEAPGNECEDVSDDEYIGPETDDIDIDLDEDFMTG